MPTGLTWYPLSLTIWSRDYHWIGSDTCKGFVCIHNKYWWIVGATTLYLFSSNFCSISYHSRLIDVRSYSKDSTQEYNWYPTLKLIPLPNTKTVQVHYRYPSFYCLLCPQQSIWCWRLVLNKKFLGETPHYNPMYVCWTPACQSFVTVWSACHLGIKKLLGTSRYESIAFLWSEIE